jgi:hypothetical protein
LAFLSFDKIFGNGRENSIPPMLAVANIALEF